MASRINTHPWPVGFCGEGELLRAAKQTDNNAATVENGLYGIILGAIAFVLVTAVVVVIIIFIVKKKKNMHKNSEPTQIFGLSQVSRVESNIGAGANTPSLHDEVVWCAMARDRVRVWGCVWI